ncbi:MAG: hypothetical protein ACODAD_14740, partial [Planctomycetota bacterium]
MKVSVADIQPRGRPTTRGNLPRDRGPADRGMVAPYRHVPAGGACSPVSRSVPRLVDVRFALYFGASSPRPRPWFAMGLSLASEDRVPRVKDRVPRV